MSVSSYLSCGTCANDATSGTIAWGIYAVPGFGGGTLAGTEVQSNDGTLGTNGNAAGAGFTSTATSQWLKCTNFGFSTSDVPSGATINGIEIQILEARAFTPAFTAINIKFVKGGTISGNDITTATDMSTTETADVYGGATELGGLSWADTDIRSSNFGIALQFVNGSSRLAAFGSIAYVDQVQVRVYYTTGGGGGGFTTNLSSTFETFLT